MFFSMYFLFFVKEEGLGFVAIGALACGLPLSQQMSKVSMIIALMVLPMFAE